MATFSAIVQLTYTILGSGQPGATFADTINESNTSSPGRIISNYAFSTGDNTLTVPTGATQLIVKDVTGTLKLCSSAGIAGYPLGTSVAAKFYVSGTVVLNASAGAIGTLVWL